MNTPEERIIYFIDYLKESGEIKFREDLFQKVGIRRQYYNSVRNGKNRFTTTQILALCKHYPLNANWVFAIEKNMLRQNKKGHTP